MTAQNKKTIPVSAAQTKLSTQTKTASRSHPRTGFHLKTIAFALTLTLIAGCTAGKPELVPSDDTASPTVTVHALDNLYDPAEVTIKRGEAVRWVFEGVNEHDVVANDRSFVSELVREGSYTHKFKEPGDYSYICSIHPEMRGVIHVK